MDEENLGKLLQAFSNCNYIEFVKIFSMIHGFDATFAFLRNALTTIPAMAFKRNKEPSVKRQAIRSTWEGDEEDLWAAYNLQQQQQPQVTYDSDHGYSKQPSFKNRKFSDLPFEMVIYIFGMLKSTDLMGTSLVSKSWHRYSFVSTTSLNIDFSALTANGRCEELVERKIYKHSEYLKKIRCSKHPLFASLAINTILAHCRSVVDLQFYHCPGVTDTDVARLCTGLPHLRRMVLHSEQLTARAIESLAQSATLTEIELGGFSRVPCDAFSMLGRLTTLRSLDVSGVAKQRDFVVHLAKLTMLTGLRLRIASEATIAALPYLSNLHSLSIAEWEPSDTVVTTTSDAASRTTLVEQLLIDGSRLHFLAKCTSLTRLELAAPSDADFVVRDLVALRGLTGLRELDIDVSYEPQMAMSFVRAFETLTNIESLFLSSFNLSGDCWRAFTSMPALTALSMCCTAMDADSIARGFEHLGYCRALQRIAIINSTPDWIDIDVRSFSSILHCTELSQLRLGGSRGGGWVLSEAIFEVIGRMRVLQHLDTANSIGISESCFVHLSECRSLESLECGIKVSEETVRNAVAEWCGTGTLVNCPSLKKVTVDIRLPPTVSSEVTCNADSSSQLVSGGGSFNLIAKLTQ
eukprot:gene9860-11523_t